MPPVEGWRKRLVANGGLCECSLDEPNELSRIFNQSKVANP